MPDWKGFFSDPEVYQLPQEEFDVAYRDMAASDPDMQGFAPEDHSAFTQDMQQFMPQPAAPVLSPEQQEIAATVDALPAYAQEQGLLGPVVPDLVEGVPRGMFVEGIPQILGTLAAAVQTGAGTVAGVSEDARAGSSAFDQVARMAPGLHPVVDKIGGIFRAVESIFAPLSEPAGIVEEAAKETSDDFNVMREKAGRVMFGEPSKIQSFKDVNNVSDFVELSSNLGGQVAPSIIAMSAAGPAAPVVATGLGVGDVQQSVNSSGGELDSQDVLALGLGSASLEYIGFSQITKALPPAAKKALANWAVKAAARVTESVAVEATTETAQELVNIGAERLARGEKLTAPLTPDDIDRLKTSAYGGALGGGGTSTLVNARNAIGEKIAADEVKTTTKKVERILDPEGQAVQGNIEMRREAGIDPAESRFRAKPAYLTDAEAQTFSRGEQLDVPAIATRLARPEAEIVTELDTAVAEAEKQQFTPSTPAQPSPEGDRVVGLVGRSYENLAKEVEAEGLTERAAEYRAAVGKVQTVEPKTAFERAVVGLGGLGSGAKVALFTQPMQTTGTKAGIFVEPGLIAIDVSDGLPAKAIVGTMYHELTHNQAALSPDAYAGALEALRDTPMWQESAKRLGEGAPESEIFAGVMESGTVAEDVIYALANYANVEDMAKAPGKVRAVAEWITSVFRKIANKLGFEHDLKGLNLQQMKRISTIFSDPNTKRNSAKAVLEITDMLKAGKTVETATGETEFSTRPSEIRAEEGQFSPRSMGAAQAQINEFHHAKKVAKPLLDNIGIHPYLANKKAIEAGLHAAANLEVLEENEYSDEQKAVADFARGVGVQISFYNGKEGGTGGYSSVPGQVWINTNGNSKTIGMHAIVVHEMMHELRKRDEEAWRFLVDLAKKSLPRKWGKQYAYIQSHSSYQDLANNQDALDDEVFAWVMHAQAHDFWNAVAALGAERKGPPSFQRFERWLSAKLVKLTRLWNAMASRISGKELNLKRPEQILALGAANTLAEMTSPDGGDYSHVNLAANKARKTQTLYVRDQLVSKFPDSGEAKLYTQEFAPPQFSTRVGYPPAAQTPAQLRTWRTKLAKMIWQGVKGKYWYEHSARGILKMTGGDARMATKFSRVLAVYSPQTGVPANWHRALTAWQRYVGGMSEAEFLSKSMGLTDNHTEAANILYHDMSWSGEKTNSFFNNLIALLDPEKEQKVTVDMWMMRAFGFSGDAPTTAQYREMEKEVRQLAKRFDIEQYQAQAMVWVYAKTVWEAMEPDVLAEAKRQKMTVKFKVLKADGTPMIRFDKEVWKNTPEYEALYREMFNAEVLRDTKADVTKYPISDAAMMTFGTALKKNVGYISMEHIPGFKTGMLTGLIDGKIEDKVTFHQEIEEAFTDEDGADIVAQELGYGAVSSISDMTIGPSAYVNSAGNLEVNPSRQIEMPVAAERGAESSAKMVEVGLREVELYAVIRGKLTHQESVAGYRPFFTQVAAERNGIEVKVGRTLNEAEIKEVVGKVQQMLEDAGEDPASVAVYPSRDGVRLVAIKGWNGLYDNTKDENDKVIGWKKLHDLIKFNKKADTGIKLSFNATYNTFAAETFYIESGDYGKYIEKRPDVFKRVEARVKSKLAKVYAKYAKLGYGETKEAVAPKKTTDVADIEPGKRAAVVKIPKVPDFRPLDIQSAAAFTTDDGKAFFSEWVDVDVVKQHFEDVRSTPDGLVASKPIRPQFSTRLTEPMVPVGKEEVVNDTDAFGAEYSPGSGAAWSLPKLDRWNWFVKKIQDSFIQFKRLNEVFEDSGVHLGEDVDVRLAEELYHGKVQEMTKRVDNKYVTPLMRELRALAKGRDESYEQLIAKFDEFLHARHAPERNAHIKEVWFDRKLEQLAAQRLKVKEKLFDMERELGEATDDAHISRLESAIKFWKIKVAGVEKKIEAVKKQPELNCGMSDAEARGVMKQTRLDGLDKTFGRMAARYIDHMLKARLDSFLSEGLITKQEYDNVSRYKYYVPLKGKGSEGDIDQMLDDYHDFGSGAGFDIRGSELPFVTGRESDVGIAPIVAQSIVDSLSAVDRIERNRVANALLKLAEENPNSKLWEVNKRVRKRIFDKKTGTVKDVEDWWAKNQANVVAAKRDGETYYVTLKDRGLAEAMKGLGVENLWKWVRTVRVMMRTLAQLYTTWSPEFVLTNFARDYQQAIVSATTDMGREAAIDVAKNASRAVRGIMAANFPNRFGKFKNEYTDAYHEMKESGGKVGFFGMRGVDDMHKAILDEMNSGGLATTARGVRRVGDYISAINEATENGIRLATYVAAKNRGATRAQAASLAKNVSVNFNRRGDVGGAIGAGYLFFNAGVQGVDRFWRSMKTPAGQKLAAAYLGIGFLTSIWSRAMMGEDDDGEDLYDKISDFTKGRHWIIASPLKKGDYLQIPLPYGFGVWGQLGKELEHLIFSGDDRIQASQEAALRMLSGLTTHFSPIGETSFNQGLYAFLRPIVPTLAEPFTDLLANETYWGGRIYPSKAPWDRRTSSSRVYPAKTVTDKVLIGVTQALNKYTGGSDYRPGVINVNANGLSYVLDSYIGPTGKFLKRPFDLAQKLAAGENTTWNDWVILRRFLAETAPEYYVPGEFYDAIEDVGRAVEERKALKESGSREDAQRWEPKHGWKTSLKKEASEAQEKLRKLRKEDTRAARDEALRVQRAFVTKYLQLSKR